MNNQNFSAPFTFHKTIDAEYINSLYENDYTYIEELFKTALDHYDEDVMTIRQNLADDNAAGLKKAVHKIKPVFGFIGMLDMQQSCKDMEDRCQVAELSDEIKNEIRSLLTKIDEAKSVLRKEYERLKEFNQQPG